MVESKAEEWNASEQQGSGHEIGVGLGTGGVLLIMVVVVSDLFGEVEYFFWTDRVARKLMSFCHRKL